MIYYLENDMDLRRVLYTLQTRTLPIDGVEQCWGSKEQSELSGTNSLIFALDGSALFGNGCGFSDAGNVMKELEQLDSDVQERYHVSPLDDDFPENDAAVDHYDKEIAGILSRHIRLQYPCMLAVRYDNSVDCDYMFEFRTVAQCRDLGVSPWDQLRSKSDIRTLDDILAWLRKHKDADVGLKEGDEPDFCTVCYGGEKYVPMKFVGTMTVPELIEALEEDRKQFDDATAIRFEAVVREQQPGSWWVGWNCTRRSGHAVEAFITEKDNNV